MFYYAGHGIQIDGENYLVSVDFHAQDEATTKRAMAYSAQLVLDRMSGAGASLNILILDACRDNPFRSMRGGARGWASMPAGKGSFIAFATAPGATASDNPGAQNGLFTQYLLQSLAKPDLDINGVFDEVTDAVDKASNGRQTPWVTKSVVGRFVFRDPALEEARYTAVQTESGAVLKTHKPRLRRSASRRGADQAGAARTRTGGGGHTVVAAHARGRGAAKRLGRGATGKGGRAGAVNRRRSGNVPGSWSSKHGHRSGKTERWTRRPVWRSCGYMRPIREAHSELTMEQAKAGSLSLRRKSSAIQYADAPSKSRALQQPPDDYGPLRALVPGTVTRDELDTTAEYQAKLASAQKQRQD